VGAAALKTLSPRYLSDTAATAVFSLSIPLSTLIEIERRIVYNQQKTRDFFALGEQQAARTIVVLRYSTALHRRRRNHREGIQQRDGLEVRPQTLSAGTNLIALGDLASVVPHLRRTFSRTRFQLVVPKRLLLFHGRLQGAKHVIKNPPEIRW
jgi:hypothetical protein